MSGSLLRPNTISVARRPQGAVSPTGEPSKTVSTIATGVPALIDAVPVSSRMGGDLRLEVEGVIYVQTHVGMIDGLTPAQVGSAAAGSTITIAGVAYVVSANQRGAFVDVQPGDKLTDESGKTYLVLAIATYYEVMPNLQCRLQVGRAW